VLQNFDRFEGRGLDVLKIWEGGLVWYGGFALAALFTFFWLWKRKLPVLPVTDGLVLGLALALAVGRWGCFCAGDDYGKVIAESGDQPTWYAVQFPRAADGWRYAYSETPIEFRAPKWLHPVQLYMSLGNLLVFGALAGIARLVRKPGVLTACYLMLYPLQRSIVETWRGDADRGVDYLETGLSFSQFFSIPVFLFGLLMLRYALSRPQTDDAHAF
jgi:phosphatidylglycerol:prolipoprotein diacylglycerol transferase